MITEQEIQAFAERCREMISRYYAEHYPNNPREELTVSMGKKYAKLIHSGAFAFVDLTTGDILKPATWSAPAKHARGNIRDEWEGMKFMGPYGPAYLR